MSEQQGYIKSSSNIFVYILQNLMNLIPNSYFTLHRNVYIVLFLKHIFFAVYWAVGLFLAKGFIILIQGEQTKNCYGQYVG